MKIKKAVFPVAGLGTRFLPATKAMPKEMLPVVDKPLIQYAVEEAFASGIEEIIFVTGKGKRAIANHFDYACEIENSLYLKNKVDIAKKIKSIVPESGTISYTVQNKPLGLGHAIWCARNIVKNEPFAVLLADDLLKSDKPVLLQMIQEYEKKNSSIVAVMEIDKRYTDQYGIVNIEKNGNKLMRMKSIVEKPKRENAPSNLAAIGRYILKPEIFDILSEKEIGAGDEIQLTDAIAKLMKTQNVFAYQFDGERFDCGDKAGFQMANIAFAMNVPAIKEKLVPFLQKIVDEQNR